MSINKNLPNNEQLAEYLDQKVPLQQLEVDELNDLPAFMQAQLVYAKSKHSKKLKKNRKSIRKNGLTVAKND